MRTVLLLVLLFFAATCNAQVAPAVNASLSNCDAGNIVRYTGSAVACAGGTPTMGSCGTSPSVTGDNLQGRVTVGTGGVTSCTVNFSATLSAAPFCILSASITSVVLTSTSTTTLVIGHATDMSSAVVAYFCWNAF